MSLSQIDGVKNDLTLLSKDAFQHMGITIVIQSLTRENIQRETIKQNMGRRYQSEMSKN